MSQKSNAQKQDLVVQYLPAFQAIESGAEESIGVVPGWPLGTIKGNFHKEQHPVLTLMPECYTQHSSGR